jgi:hypothetical protein
MQITSAPSTTVDLLAPASAPSEPRTTDAGSANARADASAFTAMLSAMMATATATATATAAPTPTPTPAAAPPATDAETVDAAAEQEEETNPDTSAIGAEAQPMDALLYGLRTDAQLGRLGDELGSPSAARPPEPTGEELATHASATHGGAEARRTRTGWSDPATGSGATRAAERQAVRDAVRDAPRDAEPLDHTDTPAGNASVPNAGDTARAHATGSSAVARAALVAEGAAPIGASVGAPASTHDVRSLDPELQERLTRVVERMRDEFGYDVEIVETTRSQARQDQLFAQGRTRPGPVVTWTRSSQHTLGRAVDVNIDGSWENTEAFQLLQRIAREEGLRTLGPRDAGHLELARNAARSHGAADTPAASPDGGAAHAHAHAHTPSAPPHAAAQGGVQHATPTGAVAQVAAVARVAEVAQVAVVAQPGAAPVQAAVQVAVRENAGPSGETHGTRVARGPGSPAAARRGAREDESRTEGEPTPGLAAAATLAAGQAPRVAASAAPVLGAAAVERLTRVTDQIEAGTAGRHLSHLTLRIDNAAGGQDHIRVDLRGLTVDAQIAVADASTAERMADRMGELRDALGRQGLSADTVSISAAGARAADGAAAAPSDAGRAAAVATARAAQDAGASSGSAQQQHSSTPHQKPDPDPTPRDAARDTTRDPQQHASRDGRRGHDAEPWFTDDVPAPGRARARTR